MALSVPQGGFTAGYPSGSRNLAYWTRYFWSMGVLTPCPPLRSGVRTPCPRHLIRVDVQDRRLGVERRTAPFRATVQAWEHDGALKACRDELAAALHRAEALQHGAVRVRRTIREHVFAEPLARKWLRGERERLRIGGHLTFDV